MLKEGWGEEGEEHEQEQEEKEKGEGGRGGEDGKEEREEGVRMPREVQQDICSVARLLCVRIFTLPLLSGVASFSQRVCLVWGRTD